MRLLATDRSEQNRAALDPWTVVHFAAGLALGLTRVPARWAATAALVYEVAEQFVERRRLGQEFFNASGPETPENIVMDLTAFASGYRMGGLWSRSGRGRGPA